VWIAAGVAVLAVPGFFAVRAVFATAAAGEPDLRKVVIAFDDAWAAGDVSRLASHHHPDGRGEFRERLAAMAAGRGWEDGFPTIVSSMSRSKADLDDLEGDVALDPDGVTTGLSMHAYPGGWLYLRWQFEPTNTTWYLYGMQTSPTDMDARLEAFRAAWSRSSPGEVAGFFAPGSEAKLQKAADFVEQRMTAAGWGADYPPLGDLDLDPDPSRFTESVPDGFTTPTVETTFETDAGPLGVRWKWHQASDAWCIAGFVSYPRNE